MSDSERPTPPAEGSVRKHVYDGIEEYNKRLPNWWLFTLYIMIAFSIAYWFYYAQSGIPEADGPRVEAEIARIEAERMKTSFELNDENLWAMSQQPALRDEGKATFDSLCAACHLPSLKGKSENPAAIGPDLTDEEWIHGAAPMALYAVVDKGVLEKGMPAWGPVLGSEKSAIVVAYILSYHQAP
jgi:cytochrome c oxidase cbb3-type subunit III